MPPTTSSLVDAFVEKVNTEPREALSPDEVPEFLRQTSDDANGTVAGLSTDWKIVTRDNSARIAELQQRTGWSFPPSFRYFVGSYSFPAFESRSLMFFANTGENTCWELASRLFNDPHMSPALLRAGFLQIGNPFFYNYDPICFDCKGPKPEKRIVQLDHEEILCNDRIRIIGEIAPSFPELLQVLLGDRRA